jgi:hypothetical protein
MMWFGAPWNPRCCDPGERSSVPEGGRCSGCDAPIVEDDQGFLIPHCPLKGMPELRPIHLDCFLKTVLPHGPSCEHCRGKNKQEHATFCEYRQGTGNCNCVNVEDL